MMHKQPAAASQDDSLEAVVKTSFIPQFGLLTGLLIVIGVSCLIVVLSYVLYLNNPQYKYDLARPDIKTANSAVTSEQNDITDTTSRVDAPSIKRKLDFLNKELVTIESINSFSEKEVTDQALQLDTDIPPSY